MNNKEFGKRLEARTKQFAVDCIKWSFKQPKTYEFNVLKNQLTKSATSVGANYREANRSRSKADFINKIKICESEANETYYWLEIIQSTQGSESITTKRLLLESSELISIFTSINNKMKKKKL